MLPDIDWPWFEAHATQEILPRWLASAVTPSGAFLPRLDRQWRLQESQVLTLVSQSRLVYNFAEGYRLTGEEAYRAAAASGARFLVRAFQDPLEGGWVWACTPEGEVLDDRKDTYGHAFVLFGLAHALQVTGSAELREALHATWQVLDTRLRDADGGFVRATNRGFDQPAPGRSANPLMHLFEALLAASDAAALPGMEALDRAAFLHAAGDLAAFAVQHARADDGLLPELYDDLWRPLTTEAGGVIDLGHAFEWAFLLSAGVERGLCADLLAPAGRFLEGGLRLGLDPVDGGIRSAATMEAVPKPGGKGWWQQCEAVRALLHWAVIRGRGDLWEPAQRVLSFAKARFLDPEHGGWYGQLREDGTPASTHKGHEWKVDYHVVGMCAEAVRLSRRLGAARGDAAP